MKRHSQRKTNPRTISLGHYLNTVSKKQKASIWKKVAATLNGPSQNWAEVNIGQLDKLTKENETVLVAGKLLGAGIIKHPVEVYAFNFSAGAKKTVLSAKGKIGTIEELVEKNPKGAGVRLIK